MCLFGMGQGHGGLGSGLSINPIRILAKISELAYSLLVKRDHINPFHLMIHIKP